MPRIRRTIVAGMPHHVTQRGNYRQKIFDTDADRRQYLEWIEHYSGKYKVKVIAFCLMSNHVHFIVIPQNSDSLAKLFNTTHMRYSQYYNKKKKEKGHLWQGRYFSCVLGDDRMRKAARYVERNPVRAKLVKRAEDWSWSSAKFNMGEGESQIQIDGIGAYYEVTGSEWKEYVQEKDEAEFVQEIRTATNMSRALGSAKFIESIERKLGVSLKLIGRGRPSKAE